MATIEQVNSFINKIAPIAIEQSNKHGRKIYPSVCIAQACCESAFGTSTKMVKANAIFGIKVGKSKCHFGSAWKDKAYSTRTKECYDGKTYTEITDMFRAYDTIEESIEDYYDMLCSSSRYKQALNQASPFECIKGIQKAPYATSPTYVKTIMSIIKKYELTKYDVKEVKEKQYFPKYEGSSESIVEALISLGIDSSISYRRIIGGVNGIMNVGKANGNSEMLKRLKQGKLIKP